MSTGLTAKQRRLRDVLVTEPHRGFDLAELAKRTDTSPQGAAATAASLVRLGYAVRFTTTLGRRRVMYQAASGA